MTAAQLIAQTSIVAVWGWLAGGEIRRGRAQAFWRKGADSWSVSLDDEYRRWYDHRDGTGGGILALIQHVRGGSRAEALRWLADHRGITLDGDAPPSPAERRRYAQARRDAPELARAAGLWWTERREALERAKADALERDDGAALKAAAREHYLLGLLSSGGVVRAYLHARAADPSGTAALVAEGAEWERMARYIVARLIGGIAAEAGA
jgi:hypothetical protein